MKKLSLFAITLVSASLFTGVALAASATKSVTFKVIKNTQHHTVDFDTDGGLHGKCEVVKPLTILCTTDSDGKISAGGHIALDRTFNNPSGTFAAFLTVINPTDAKHPQNFVIRDVEAAQINTTISTTTWPKTNDETVTITLSDHH